jgi:purine-binding chemotaxis protein CheW
MTKSPAALGKRTPKTRGELKNLVRFRVGETCYAFEVANVEEVVHPTAITPLPHMAASVSGVFDHRGRVTPIVDLRARLGLPSLSANRHLKWILMRTEVGLVGFVVDRVLDVVGTADALAPPPHVGPEAHDQVIRGVVHLLDELIFVLDETKLAGIVATLQLPDAVV